MLIKPEAKNKLFELVLRCCYIHWPLVSLLPNLLHYQHLILFSLIQTKSSPNACHSQTYELHRFLLLRIPAKQNYISLIWLLWLHVWAQSWDYSSVRYLPTPTYVYSSVLAFHTSLLFYLLHLMPTLPVLNQLYTISSFQCDCSTSLCTQPFTCSTACIYVIIECTCCIMYLIVLWFFVITADIMFFHVR